MGETLRKIFFGNLWAVEEEEELAAVVAAVEATEWVDDSVVVVEEYTGMEMLVGEGL